VRQYIVDNDLTSTFTNVETALRKFLTLPVASVSGERSFSYLKRIKNAQRTTMSDDRLSAIESEFVRKIDFDDVIDAFAVIKSRKVAL
jgi:hAT family C-terminal dimerisation region